MTDWKSRFDQLRHRAGHYRNAWLTGSGWQRSWITAPGAGAQGEVCSCLDSDYRGCFLSVFLARCVTELTPLNRLKI